MAFFKDTRVFAALLRIGWRIKRRSGSHLTLSLMDSLMLFSHFMIKKKLSSHARPNR